MNDGTLTVPRHEVGDRLNIAAKRSVMSSPNDDPQLQSRGSRRAGDGDVG